MNIQKVVVLPIQHNPISRVWLPSNRHLDGLLALPMHGGGEDVREQIARKVASWGVPLNVRQAATYDGMAVWVCWIAPGTAPAGLEEVPVGVALRHAMLGPLVADIRQRLGRRSR